MEVKTNVYCDGEIWCHATWVDGEFDASDPLGIPDDATEEEAMDAARQMFAGLPASGGSAMTHEVNRVEDIHADED